MLGSGAEAAAALCQQLSAWALPLLLLFIPWAGWRRRINIYEAFTAGAAEGWATAVRIMPFLVAMLVAVNVLRASGALDAAAAALSPWLERWSVPPQLLPLLVMRPLSGSGALGLTAELLGTYGADSATGRMAAAMLGSSDTTFYILTVYFGSVGITRARYAPWIGLLGDAAAAAASIYLVRYLFYS